MKGFLETLVEDVRLAIDDPGVGATFTDAQIVRHAASAMRGVYQDIQRISSRPVVCTFDFTIAAGEMQYRLPPSVGTILNLGIWSTNGGRWDFIIRESSRMGPFRPAMYVNGTRVTLDKPADTAYNMRVEYKPSGDFRPHAGVRTFSAALVGATEFALVEQASEPTGLLLGEVDDRENAYVGGLLSVWADSGLSKIQGRSIFAHSVNPSAAGKTRLLTLDSALSPALSQDGTTKYRYEIIPEGAAGIRQSVSFKTAMTLCAMRSMAQKQSALLTEYRLSLRTDRMFEANGNQRNQNWQKDTFGVLNR